MIADFATGPEGGGVECSETLLRALDDPRRRATLAVLVDSSTPVEEAQLAALVVAEGRGGELESVRLSVRHEHLPLLASAGLVRRSAEGVVVPPPLRDDVGTVLDRIEELPSDAWGVLAALLSDPLRRATAAELERTAGATLHLDRLAAALAERAPLERTTDGVATELHHVHLPRLSDAGLVEYEPEARVVEYRGDSAIPEEKSVSRTLSAVSSFQRQLRDPPV
jgi:DNA-binding transcriptional ArsR family regulator